MVTRIKDKELRTLGRGDDTRSHVEAQKANMGYLRDHYKELVEKYPNHWVVIEGGKVISAESNPSRLISKLSKIRTGDKVIYYLASPKRRMLL